MKCTYPHCACIQADDCDQYLDNLAGPVADPDFLEEEEKDLVDLLADHHGYDSFGG